MLGGKIERETVKRRVYKVVLFLRMSLTVNSKPFRTILIKTIGVKSSNSEEFRHWTAQNNVWVDGRKAEIDQQLLIHAALKQIGETVTSQKDGKGAAWRATVLMLTTTEGIYRGTKRVRVLSKAGSNKSLNQRTTFKVTTYNILTGGKPWPDMTPYEAETTGLPHALWKNRRGHVVRALQGSDVLMLNEATDVQKNYVKNNLRNMEIGCSKLKDHNYDGSVILFDSTIFNLVDRFSATLRPTRGTQVVVAVRLQHRISKQHVVFVSLHLKSGYGNMEARRIEEFCEAIRKVNEKWTDLNGVPVVVGGDLNSDYSDSYARLVSKVVPRIKKPRLRNAAGEPKGIGVNTPTYNFWHRSAFDYILISPELQVLDMHTEKVGLPAPNADQGSDHFPVTAELLVTTSHQEMKSNLHF